MTHACGQLPPPYPVTPAPPPLTPPYTPLGARFVLAVEAEVALLVICIVGVCLVVFVPPAIVLCKRVRRERQRQRLIDDSFGRGGVMRRL